MASIDFQNEWAPLDVRNERTGINTYGAVKWPRQRGGMVLAGPARRRA